MNNENIKKLIKKIENLLKEDDRFIDNGDNIYKQHIKRIYKESKHKHKPIDISLLNQPQSIRYITKEVPSQEPIEELKRVNTQLKEENDELKEKVDDLNQELDNRISKPLPAPSPAVAPQSSIVLDFSELHKKLEALDLKNINAQLDQVSKLLGDINKL